MRKRTKKHCELHKLINNGKIYQTIDLNNMCFLGVDRLFWRDLLATILIGGDLFAES